MLILWIVCSALGAFWTVEFAKGVVPWNLEPWTKQAAAGAITAALLAISDTVHGSRFTVALLGAVGLSALLQRLHRYLGAAGDDAMASVMARGVRGRGR